MVGSGVGGFVALSAALRKDDSRNIALFLAEYTQKRDSLILKRKLPFLKKYKFSSQPLKKQIQSVFGYVKLYDRYDVDPTTPLVSYNTQIFNDVLPYFVISESLSLSLEQC